MLLTMIHLTGRQDKRSQLRAFLIEVETMRPEKESPCSTNTRCLLCPQFFRQHQQPPEQLPFISKVLLTETQNANTLIVPPSVIFTRAHLLM